MNRISAAVVTLRRAGRRRRAGVARTGRPRGPGRERRERGERGERGEIRVLVPVQGSRGRNARCGCRRGRRPGFSPRLDSVQRAGIGVRGRRCPGLFPPEQDAGGQGPIPPTTSFGGGAYSENGTWAAVGGHTRTWRNGRIRYRGLLIYASANLDFYGVGRDPGPNDNPISFNTEGGGIVQQAETRLGNSRFFAGGGYTFATTDTTFDTSLGLGEEGETDNAGLTVFVNYDTRDTSFTPSRGTRAKLAFSYFAEQLGGDFDYGRFDLAGYHYWPLFDKRLVLGMRLEYQQAGSNSPFYALPWVRLRGVPAFRYLGNYLVTAEIEPRWKIDERWSVLAFSGIGRAAREVDELDDAERGYAFGIGFRYLLARKLGLAAGIDVARGPEETTTYIIFGSAWGF